MFDVAHWRSTWSAVLIALNQYDPAAHEWSDPGGRVEAEKIARHIADVADSYRERNFGSDSMAIYDLTEVIVGYYDTHKVGADPYITRFAGDDEPMWGVAQTMRIDQIGNMLERTLGDNGVAAWIVSALKAESLALDLALMRLGRRMQAIVDQFPRNTWFTNSRPIGSISQFDLTVGNNSYRHELIELSLWPTGDNPESNRIILRSSIDHPSELYIVKCWTPLGVSLTMIEDLTKFWPQSKNDVDELMVPMSR